MNLYIQIRDGQPYEHPIMEDNFVIAFPNVDLNNLPPEFAKFERVEQPVLSKYEVYEGVSYEWFNDIVKDVHSVRSMTDEEKAAYDEADRVQRAEALKAAQSESIGVTRV
jgi:hypothetical protein